MNSRNVFRTIKKIIKKDGDRCSICRQGFQHNSKTYGGVTHDNKVAVVGECCRGELVLLSTSGFYISHGGYEALRVSEHDNETISPEKAAEAIAAYQKYIAATDELAAPIARKAGIPRSRMKMTEAVGMPWQLDDANWFKANPTRSHRLRPAFDGEMPYPVPPGYSDEVLVRQVEPGSRVRAPFHHNIEIPIPDIEPVLHALFDILAAKPQGEQANTLEIRELALKYAQTHTES